ncbi:MAG TPA: hypothetical protein P5230_00035 [Candidatus Magasanikbacteria bacterium]|nr:hypothetical protein [Candidatus Magasanikbacteria bacterium]
MGDFNRGKKSFGGGNRGGFGGRRSFGGGRGFGGGRDGGRPQMHKATCSECGNECELPFRPTGDRPVFCSTCFDKQGGGSDRPNRFGGDRGDRGERRERPRFEDRGGMHDAVCAKCGAKCQVPFRPTPGKEVLCDNCFGKGGKGGKDNGELMAEIKGLHVKLDRLMKLLTPETPVEKIVEKKEDKAKEVKKSIKKPVAKKTAGKKKK